MEHSQVVWFSDWNTGQSEVIMERKGGKIITSQLLCHFREEIGLLCAKFCLTNYDDDEDDGTLN